MIILFWLIYNNIMAIAVLNMIGMFIPVMNGVFIELPSIQDPI